MTTQIIGKTEGSLISQGYVGFPLAWFFGEKGNNSDPDLDLLNGNRLKKDGGKISRKTPDIGDIPLLIVSINGQKSDQLQLVARGSDDNDTKFADFQELLSRVRTVLGWTGHALQEDGPSTFDGGELEVEWKSHQVWVRKQRVKLTPTEFKILACLIRNRHRIVSHEQLLEEGWGPEHNGNKSFIRLYVNYLRQKIEKDPRNPRLIITERGEGYLFSEQNKKSLSEGLDQVITGEFTTNQNEQVIRGDLVKSGAAK